MIDLHRLPDSYRVETEKDEVNDASLSFQLTEGGLNVFVTAAESRPRRAILRWKHNVTRDVRILGDTWERGYGTFGFSGLTPLRAMPWYFIATGEEGTDGVGVMVQPNAMISWTVDSVGVTAWCDLRSGTRGVKLAGRTLTIGTFLSRHYAPDMTAFDAACAFCGVMSPAPLLPREPVYGGNNWYYAYGKSSYEEIVADASLQAELAEGLTNRPFMVIDDGWQVNSCAGPWRPNERYRDMKATADAFRAMGVRPGIWIRPLCDPSENIPAHWRFEHSPYLDPSRPEVLEHLKQLVHTIVSDWGFELIKHDFSSFDLIGHWGGDRNDAREFADGNWHFADESRTTAEIYLAFLRTLLDATEGKAYILGCNCLSHLTAGLCHINRTGDDTSGTDWERTRRMGVNTLAFRMPQNRHFYMCDADCAGFLPGKIPFSLNKQWVELLAKSGTPLFISAPKGAFSPEEMSFMKEMYRIAEKQENTAIPQDWLYDATPSHWQIDGQSVDFCWYEE